MQEQKSKTPKIRVLVRKRPLSKKEQLKSEEDIIDVVNNQTVVVREQKYKVDLTPFIDEYRFNFDGAYGEVATNEQIYLTSVRPLVECAFDGARVSCFAYGQTGSGKTYTMLGDSSKQVRGLYLLAAYDIFQQLQNFNVNLSVWISFYQIYCGKLYDLLNERNLLYAREDAKSNVNIVGLSERKIVSVQNLMQIIEFGTGVRVTAQNGTNVDSSRSHAILQITLKNPSNKVHGKISFIDLAGSERAADHADQLEKQTRIDGAEINKSLLALKECIRALDQNKNHTPFRGSKLTMVLKDSFTGYCRTVMIGNISPNSSSCENTLNTLKYADRVKELKKPGIGGLQMQMMQVDTLSRQLMLPRAMVQNNRKYNNNEDVDGRNTNMPLHPHNSDQYKNLQYKMTKERPNSRSNSKHEPPLFGKGSQRISTPNYNLQNSPGTRERSSSNVNNQNVKQYEQKYNSRPYSYMVNNLVQQQDPPTYTSQQSFEELAQKHEHYIQVIIEQEEDLMKTHEAHINTSIELVKEEMFLMGEADKIGSNIEDYLNNLEQVLDKQLTSIQVVQNKVRKMKADLKQSQRIERLYMQVAEGSQRHEDILLNDDSDHLFI